MILLHRSRFICFHCRLKLLTPSTQIPKHASLNSVRGRSTNARESTRISRQYLQPSSRRKISAAQRLRVEPSTETAEPASPLPPGLDLDANIPQSSEELEAIAREARQAFGDSLPENYLSKEEYTVYERLYGAPIVSLPEEDIPGKEEDGLEAEAAEGEGENTVLVWEKRKGEWQEVEYVEETSAESVEEDVEEPEASSEPHEEDARTEWPDDASFAPSSARTHPLTSAGRFSTSPSTITLPRETFEDPVSSMLDGVANKHLNEIAHRVFGGVGLPFSTATPPSGRLLKQQPIPLDASQSEMAEREGDAYMIAVMPGTYASVLSVLVEVRKRLGSSWLESLMSKEGGPRVLDAGAGGAAVVAWHEILRAEWDRLHEGSTSRGSVPLGKATVLTGSAALRHRASRLLENTTFIPRLPDLIDSSDHNTAQPRKLYDVIIAPHTLWPIRENHQRKRHVQTLWSLLNPSGGVLVLVEKGLPNGFEAIAGARRLLLEKHISSPDSTHYESELQEPSTAYKDRYVAKETGMIVAPCTNHVNCPMDPTPGATKARKDFCHFSQRFIRPSYLQRVLSARDRNHDDVQFSYLAVQRGRDQRRDDAVTAMPGMVQGDVAVDAAFAGYEFDSEAADVDVDATAADAVQTDSTHLATHTTQNISPAPLAPPAPEPTPLNMLTLPRTILPPLKRRGHIIMDMCTPAGRLERWTVPRSFSKQAFRDARKANWGDLWALGAKTRIARTPRLGRKGQNGGEYSNSSDDELLDDEDDGGLGKRGKRKSASVIEVGVNNDTTVDPEAWRVVGPGKKKGLIEKQKRTDKKDRGKREKKERRTRRRYDAELDE